MSLAVGIVGLKQFPAENPPPWMLHGIPIEPDRQWVRSLTEFIPGWPHAFAFAQGTTLLQPLQGCQGFVENPAEFSWVRQRRVQLNPRRVTLFAFSEATLKRDYQPSVKKGAGSTYDRFLHEQLAGDELIDYENVEEVTSLDLSTSCRPADAHRVPRGSMFHRKSLG